MLKGRKLQLFALAQLTIFQRTPNLPLPMRQKKLTKEDRDANKPNYPEIFKERLTIFSGFPYVFVPKNTFDDTPEAREAFSE